MGQQRPGTKAKLGVCDLTATSRFSPASTVHGGPTGWGCVTWHVLSSLQSLCQIWLCASLWSEGPGVLGGGGTAGPEGTDLWACLCLLFSCLLCLLFIAWRWAWLSSSVVTNPLVASPMPVSSLSGFTNTPAATLCAKRWAWRRYCQGLWMRELP